VRHFGRHGTQWPMETVATTRSVPVNKLAPHGIRSLGSSSHVMTEDEITPIAWKYMRILYGIATRVYERSI
jgi:hypothetical protein